MCAQNKSNEEFTWKGSFGSRLVFALIWYVIFAAIFGYAMLGPALDGGSPMIAWVLIPHVLFLAAIPAAWVFLGVKLEDPYENH